MRPVWTKAEWPPVTPLMSISDARNWLGIYGDISLDVEVKVCLDAAIEKISSNVGYRISDTKTIDYFVRNADVKLVLSEPGIDTNTIVIKYYDSTGALNTVDAAKYYLDDTAISYKLFWNEGGFPANVSSKLENPIRVEYQSKLVNILDVHSIERLKYAVRLALNWYWQSRGALLQDPYLLDKSLWSLIQSCKVDPAGD